MAENFRSRMGDLRQEIDRIASQAEDLERVVQEQQVRLEEMDLLVRQRDEQLQEQQARIEQLETTLHQRDDELTTLRAQLTEREQALAEKDSELATLRTQLAERETAEATLREQLAQAEKVAVPTTAAVPIQTFLERFAVLESMVSHQGESITTLRTLIQDEMARLHSRLEQLESRLAAAPSPVALPAVVAPPTPAVVEAAPVKAPARKAAPRAAKVAPPVAVAAPPLAPAEADSLQVVLQDTLDMLPEAALVGLAGRDGLSVEMLVRHEPTFPQPLEVELADLTSEASRVAAALGAGPLLTVAFQAGDDHLLLSPVGEEHFAYLLTPSDSPADFRRAQAVLLQAVSRIHELF